ncbi:hypothetical protein [Salinicoccus roseus]|uniref:hypothetical protein n=1 Tax=Salinicoccus roseus TaxID=45670 RepID=UPI001EF4072A|nr:hypothetical protein [Salinicoccus roseus]MCG7333034.1 hypothetical protein [Salinicoccus roseus]
MRLELLIQFDDSGPNQKGVANVRRFKLAEEQKAYLSAIYNLGSGRIVSHVLGHSNNNPFVCETFRQVAQTTNGRNTFSHSDRGFQYKSRTFHKLLQNQDLCSGSAGASKMAG